jgi:curved DNA-binding protein
MAAISRKDYYSLLQVQPEADFTELKKAYHRLAVLWHPDRNPGSQMAEDRFKAIAEAYAVLSDPKKRKRYDEVGHEIFSGEFTEKDIFQGFEINDLFKEFGLPTNDDTLERLLDLDKVDDRDTGRVQDFFGGFGQGKGERRSFGKKKAGDLKMQIFISLKVAIYGGEHLAAFNTVNGAMKTKVKIPKGTEDGTQITVPNKVPGAKNEESGDLVITIKILPNPNFARRGANIYTKLSLSAKELKNGAHPIVNTLDGKDIRINVAPGTKPGTKLKVTGLGVPQRTGKGNLIISLCLKD